LNLEEEKVSEDIETLTLDSDLPSIRIPLPNIRPKNINIQETITEEDEE